MTARKHLQNNSTFSGWKNKINQQTPVNWFQAKCDWRGREEGSAGESRLAGRTRNLCFFLRKRK